MLFNFSKKNKNNFLRLFYFFIFLFFSFACLANLNIPTIELNIKDGQSSDNLVPAMKIVGLLTILTVAPAILLMMTSFTRILIVLSFVRQAIGTQTMPPNQVILGLSLFLTLFTMTPLWKEIESKSLNPYLEKKINQSQALEKLSKPVKAFMMNETREGDLALFYNISKLPRPNSNDDVPMSVLIPSFMISELKTAFQIGFFIIFTISCN